MDLNGVDINHRETLTFLISIGLVSLAVCSVALGFSVGVIVLKFSKEKGGKNLSEILKHEMIEPNSRLKQKDNVIADLERSQHKVIEPEIAPWNIIKKKVDATADVERLKQETAAKSERNKLLEALKASEAQVAAKSERNEELDEALKASEAQTAAKSERNKLLEEALKASEAQVAAKSEQNKELDEALKASEAQVAAKSERIKELEEALKASETTPFGLDGPSKSQLLFNPNAVFPPLEGIEISDCEIDDSFSSLDLPTDDESACGFEQNTKLVAKEVLNQLNPKQAMVNEVLVKELKLDHQTEKAALERRIKERRRRKIRAQKEKDNETKQRELQELQRSAEKELENLEKRQDSEVKKVMWLSMWSAGKLRRWKQKTKDTRNTGEAQIG